MWELQVQMSPSGPDWSAPSATHWIVAQEVTIGRPAKAGAAPPAKKVDITIAGDSAVSKIHAELHQHADGSLEIKDLGRYGTYVNGDKMKLESTRQLQHGDVLKLATKVHVRVVRTQLVLLVPLQQPDNNGGGSGGSADAWAQVQAAAPRLDASTTRVWVDGVTHVVADEGAPASGATARALLTPGVRLVKPSWLGALTSNGAVLRALPDEGEHAPAHTCVAVDVTGALQPCGLPAAPGQLPSDFLAPCIRGGDTGGANASLLRGLRVAFVDGFRDDDLAYCLQALGAFVSPSASVLASAAAASSAPPKELAVSETAKFLHRDAASGRDLPHMPAPELLACVLAADASPVHERLASSALLTQPPPAALAASADAAHGEHDDMTEEEDEDDVEHMPKGPAQRAGRGGAAGGAAGAGPAAAAAATAAAAAAARSRPRSGDAPAAAGAGGDGGDADPFDLPLSPERASEGAGARAEDAGAPTPARAARGTRGRQQAGEAPTLTTKKAVSTKQAASAAAKHGPAASTPAAGRRARRSVAESGDGDGDTTPGRVQAGGRAGGQFGPVPELDRAGAGAPPRRAEYGLAPGAQPTIQDAVLTEKVGPGHVIMYVPLLFKDPTDGAEGADADNAGANGAHADGDGDLPNYKRFRKAGSSNGSNGAPSHAPGGRNGARAHATPPAQPAILAMMTFDSHVPASTVPEPPKHKKRDRDFDEGGEGPSAKARRTGRR
ncbi:hypothetical protein FOA52_002818 [Chlamydomonas sp. UWO 241]|nr:hypothetical protein FOA52_002818 [Chlamydomonas sp. UWO 241]